jgi:hypothetical protein
VNSVIYKLRIKANPFLAGAIVVVVSIFAWAFFTMNFSTPDQLPAAVEVPEVRPSPPEPVEPERSSVPVFPYIEIIDSCGPYFVEDCVVARSGPGQEYDVITHLRKGIVLKVAETVTDDKGGEWYKIDLSEFLWYRERITSDWYVSSDVAYLFYDDGEHVMNWADQETSTKRIVVDVSEQKLYAYNEDNTLFMEEFVSTGAAVTPTIGGTFRIFKMMPSRYMQGPLPGSEDYYDLPGVPWDMYFTADGAVIHGAYWHNNFGSPRSHGCVNMPIQKAKKLYYWAELGTVITVQQ